MNGNGRYALLAAALFFTTSHAAQVTGGDPQTLHSFCYFHDMNDGLNPAPSMIRGPDGAYYGVTFAGGIQNAGTIYRLDPATRAYSVIHSFDEEHEGSYPVSSLAVGSDGNLYGALQFGGPGGFGDIFRLSTAGEFTLVYAFTASDGRPYSSLVEDGEGNWYGTMFASLPANGPYVYKLTADGTFMPFYAFPSDVQSASALVLAKDGNLYGTASTGGSLGGGMVFRLTPDAVFASLHDFPNEQQRLGHPQWPLIAGRDGRLYGTTADTSGIFRIGLDGQFTVLVNFFGAEFYTSLAPALAPMPDGSLYGIYGVSDGPIPKYDSSLFRISPTGQLNVVYSFEDKNFQDGEEATGGLLRGFDNALYGVTYFGGKCRAGSVFRYVPSPVQ